MNIDNIRTFYQVAQTNSFTQAARDLYLTQPAVSQQIQNLENSLGVTLFDRGRRKVILTREGEILFNYAQKIFGLLHDLESAFENLNELSYGHLNLGATAIMGTYYLPQFIAMFHAEHPGVKITLNIKNSHLVAELVHQDALDLAFGGSSTAHPGLSRHFLHRESLILVCAKTSPLLRRPQPLKAEDLTGESLILREAGTRVTNTVLAWLRERGIPAPSLLTVNNMEATKALVSAGVGVTILPRHTAQEELDAGRLVQLQMEDFRLYTDYFLLYATGRKMSNAARAFLSVLHTHGVPLPKELLE